MKVKDVMTAEVVTIGPDTAFKDLLDRMVRADVNSIPVVDDNGRLLGIVTEADLISKEAYGTVRHRSLALLADIVGGGDHHWVAKARGSTAKEVMTPNLVACTPGEDLRLAARRMLQHRVKCMPVLESGVLVGIVSRHDILSVFDRPDEAIAADVARSLSEDLNMPDDHHVEFSVDNGTVVVSGDVRYGWDAPIVISIVREVPGVIEVIDQLHRREPNPRSKGRSLYGV